MGLSACIPLHARHRHGPDRGHDHRKTPQRRGRGRRLARFAAGLILSALTVPVHSETLRLAVYHTEAERRGPGLLLRDILKGDDQIAALVEVIRAADADILVLAGIDRDHQALALAALADAIGGYPHRFSGPTNRGRATGADLDGDGRWNEAEDSEGFGAFTGQGAMAILSRLPLDAAAVRDFTALPWVDLPGHIAPDGTASDRRLSTTSHWVIPTILPDGSPLTLMTWYATPPVFDGPEDRNGRRNHDEAAFWFRLLDGDLGPSPAPPFALLGIANLDPVDGEGRAEALTALLTDPRLHDPRPTSPGAPVAATADGGANLRHRGDPALDTVDWADTGRGPGNLRVSYILPSADLTVAGSGVLWPAPDDPLARSTSRASRHRLVWVDLCISACD
jgi:hypothetical protein